MHSASTQISGIILMGGEGSRFNSTLPKQFHRLAGKKVYLHTLEQFLKVAEFTHILLVCPKSWLNEIKKEIAIYQDPRIHLVIGGATRQESSFLGLKECPSETQVVVIHDAVRPFVTKELLLANIKGALKHGAVDTCIPSQDTIVYAEAPFTVGAIPKRSDYWRGQTPQSFYYPLMIRAHEKALRHEIFNASDDCALVLGLGHPIHIIEGTEDNIKITTELDLFLAEQILRRRPASLLFTEIGTRLAGKRFAITGGSGGIGQAIVKKLQEAGATALLISRSSIHYPSDLTSSASAQLIFTQIQQEHGPLDGLINSIGQLTMRPIEALFPEEIESLIATNLTSIIYSCKYAYIKDGGHIVNIASSSYLRGKKNYAIYSSAKAAVVNFTQGLADERPLLKINALIPERTNTPMRRTHFPNEDVSTLLQPEEVADAILSLLCSSELTGATAEVRQRHISIDNHRESLKGL